MTNVQTSIDVDCPVRTVYDQWTQFEEFPSFMSGVEEVRQLDVNTVHWAAEIGGQHREWDARIIEQVPDKVVAWRSIDGADNSGVVRFEPLAADRTRVTLNLTFEPEGVVESIGDMLGIVSRRAEEDLSRFKVIIEHRGEATAGWRGEIHGSQVKSELEEDSPEGEAGSPTLRPEGL